MPKACFIFTLVFFATSPMKFETRSKINWISGVDNLLLPHIKLFQKNKKSSGTTLRASFFSWFLKSNSHDTFNYLTKFHFLIAFNSWDIGQYVYCNCLFPILCRQKFEINRSFLIKPFFNNQKNLRQKFK